jgi:phage regulator Rha-like protein
MELINDKNSYTSLDIAEWTGKLHKNIMADIRKEGQQLSATAEGACFFESNFQFVENTNTEGIISNAYFVITRVGAQQLVMRYGANVRMKINLKLEELQEREKPIDLNDIF